MADGDGDDGGTSAAGAALGFSSGFGTADAPFAVDEISVTEPTEHELDIKSATDDDAQAREAYEAGKAAAQNTLGSISSVSGSTSATGAAAGASVGSGAVGGTASTSGAVAGAGTATTGGLSGVSGVSGGLGFDGSIGTSSGGIGTAGGSLAGMSPAAAAALAGLASALANGGTANPGFLDALKAYLKATYETRTIADDPRSLSYILASLEAASSRTSIDGMNPGWTAAFTQGFMEGLTGAPANANGLSAGANANAASAVNNTVASSVFGYKDAWGLSTPGDYGPNGGLAGYAGNASFESAFTGQFGPGTANGPAVAAAQVAYQTALDETERQYDQTPFDPTAPVGPNQFGTPSAPPGVFGPVSPGPFGPSVPNFNPLAPFQPFNPMEQRGPVNPLNLEFLPMPGPAAPDQFTQGPTQVTSLDPTIGFPNLDINPNAPPPAPISWQFAPFNPDVPQDEINREFNILDEFLMDRPDLDPMRDINNPAIFDPSTFAPGRGPTTASLFGPNDPPDDFDPAIEDFLDRAITDQLDDFDLGLAISNMQAPAVPGPVMDDPIGFMSPMGPVNRDITQSPLQDIPAPDPNAIFDVQNVDFNTQPDPNAFTGMLDPNAPFGPNPLGGPSTAPSIFSNVGAIANPDISPNPGVISLTNPNPWDPSNTFVGPNSPAITTFDDTGLNQTQPGLAQPGQIGPTSFTDPSPFGAPATFGPDFAGQQSTNTLGQFTGIGLPGPSSAPTSITVGGTFTGDPGSPSLGFTGDPSGAPSAGFTGDPSGGLLGTITGTSDPGAGNTIDPYLLMLLQQQQQPPPAYYGGGPSG
jgi:hypothetical protein